MGTVTTLPRGREFTRADLEALPDDGRRHELIDGALVVTPPPSIPHQIVVGRLHDGSYLEVGHAVGDDELTLGLPYPVTIRPGDLASQARPTPSPPPRWRS